MYHRFLTAFLTADLPRPGSLPHPLPQRPSPLHPHRLYTPLATPQVRAARGAVVAAREAEALSVEEAARLRLALAAIREDKARGASASDAAAAEATRAAEAAEAAALAEVRRLRLALAAEAQRRQAAEEQAATAAGQAAAAREQAVAAAEQAAAAGRGWGAPAREAGAEAEAEARLQAAMHVQRQHTLQVSTP